MKLLKYLSVVLTALLLVSGAGLSANAAVKFDKSPLPVIEGRAVVGQSLTVNLGVWSPTPDDYTYQWKINNVAVSQAAGGDQSSFAVTDAQFGKSISVAVTAYLEGYPTTTKASVAVKIQKPFDSYINPSVPTDIWVGDQITTPCGLDDCSAPCTKWVDGYYDDYGDWVDDQSCSKWGAEKTIKDSWSPVAATMKYQWLRDGLAIKSATKNYYTVVAADMGHQISLQISGSKTGYEILKLVSSPSNAVQIRQFEQSPAPTLSEASVASNFGDTLEAELPSEWLPAPDNYVCQWLRDDAPIKGADELTYTLTVADIGHSIKLRLTGELEFYETVSRDSNATEVISLAGMSQPTDVALSGIVAVGQSLTVPTNGWVPAKPKFTFQWLRDGDPIAKATKATYKLTKADLGALISVDVTASLAGYNDEVLTVTAASEVLEKTFSTRPKPTVSGTLKIGATLTAKTGTYKPVPDSFEYQWYKDSVAINDATEATLEVDSEDAGHKFSVQVTAIKDGLATVVQVSAGVNKWKTKTGSVTIDGTDVIAQCSSGGSGSCFAEIYCEDSYWEPGYWDGYEDEYGDWVDEWVDGEWVDGECYEDQFTGWYGLEPEADDAGDIYFDKSFRVELDNKPLSWSASFIGFKKGAYVFNGNYKFTPFMNVEGEDDVLGPSTVFKKNNKKGSVRTSKVSKLSEGNQVSFNLYSTDESAEFWITGIKISYTYYE